jgi:hypothetical protein
MLRLLFFFSSSGFPASTSCSYGMPPLISSYVTHHISRPPASLYSPYATAFCTSHDFPTNQMRAKSAPRHLVSFRGAEGKATHRGPAANGVFVACGVLNPCWYFLRRTSPHRGLLMAVSIRLRVCVNSSSVFELDHSYTGVAAGQIRLLLCRTSATSALQVLN